MAEPPPELSVTPPGTPLSVSPNPSQRQHQHHNHNLNDNHNDPSTHNHNQTGSMDDPDAEGARTPKRQRVDSGSGVHEILSIEAASAASADAASASLLPSPIQNQDQHQNQIQKLASTPTAATPTPFTASTSTSTSASASTSTSTPARPAKVTINMKSPTELPEPDPEPEPLDSSTDPTLLADLPQSPSPPDPTTPTSICNSNRASPSSREASPHIEIADPEDMEQDSMASNWRNLDDIVHTESQSEANIIDVSDTTALIDLFPRARSDFSPSTSLSRFVQLMDNGDMYEAAAALQKVQYWLDDCARNLHRLTLQDYLESGDFWEKFPVFVDALLRRKTNLPMNNQGGLLSCLREFLLDYIQISLHLVEQDTIILRALADEPDQQTPESVSHRYLHYLPVILSSGHIPLYATLDRIHGSELRDVLIDIREQTLGPLKAAEKIVGHCALVLQLIPKHPQLLHLLSLHLASIRGIVDCSIESVEDPDLQLADARGVPSTSIDQLYKMTRSIDTKYQEWITKKSPWITSEISESLQQHISRAMQDFCRRDDTFLQRFSNDLSIDLPQDSNVDEDARILLMGWKFGVLKKHIMEGRMELRVHGVDKMQSELVYLWKERISNDADGTSQPLVQYLVNFIKENKIVDYLVGVDSHPQLISRSSNIVGFLVVTSTYTDHETDIIWKTVTDSQDSRIVSEVLSMLIQTFYTHTTASPALLYLCEKLSVLPLDRFDSHMFDFCDKLLGQMMKPAPGHMYSDLSDSNHAHAIPLRLCVRMIRESTVTEDLSSDQRRQLQSFGSRKLSGFIKNGIGEDDRMEMYQRCIQDIAEMNQFTTGSIQALSALVPQWDMVEMRKLATDFDLTRLVINDMLHTVEATNFDLADCFSQYGLVSRVEILSRLISQAPETVTSDLGSALWNQILLTPKMGHEGHKSVWAMMVTCLARSSSQNSFLDRCIHEYMPNLTPNDYDAELLLFAKQSVYYEIRFNPPTKAGENEIISIPGMDRIWDIILTAPSGTVEVEATKFAIEVYLDHQIIQNSPRSAVDATHIAIVGRCVDQLKSAATNVKSKDTSMSVDMNGAAEMKTAESNGDDERDKLIFKRSLLFLHQLLDGLRTRPRYSTPQGSPASLPQRPIKGDKLDIKWQSFHGSSASKIRSLQIGNHSTAAELTEILVQLTGFSKFSAIAGGARLNLSGNPDTLLKDIKALQAGLLIIRKAADAEELHQSSQSRSSTSVDSEVMKYFDDIYPFLALDVDLSEQTFTFLTAFPPKDWILERVKSQTSDAKDLFPFQQPYVAFYMFHALLRCVDDESIETSPNFEFIRHSIDVLLDFLMADELSQPAINNPMESALAASAIDLLLRLVSIYPIETENRVLFSDPQPLVKRLLGFIDVARSFEGSAVQLGQGLACNSFAILAEASLRDHTFWATVKSSIEVTGLIQTLLLEQEHQSSRKDVAERIKKACGSPKPSKQVSNGNGTDDVPMSSTENPSHVDMLATIWESLVAIIPKSSSFASQSEEFFQVCLSVFQAVTGLTHCDATLDKYVQEWSEALFARLHLCTAEFVGRETKDHMVFGLAVLLEMCLETADLAGLELHTTDIGNKILSDHLFPSLSPDPSPKEDSLIVPRIPVLHSATRHKLLSIVLLLSKQNPDNIASTVQLLDCIIPRDNQCNGSWLIDRTKMLRAPEGYAGLTNLSNTCYLNSLMTQLFMNVEFRNFILQLQLVDSESSQQLLDQTQKVFALMQNSWLKSVDPIDFVESIRTYDNEAIDVTVQMDVDEFYNLLFDRCEAQIVDPEQKKKFRSFYGGQLVQQIKSKECPHISERLEPFSAIQCDIKGMASLEESLQAYVEGEIMQGDNKYSCTPCGRHVDAVKRACLKEVPDNLIFHLKRFDFDMMTMLRSKINDQFKFPHLIDMSPYNVEYLSDPDGSVKPDMFELVGVLVHTGTAESGHYYSYTRERPNTDSNSSWVEFNDADVSRFDPANLADQCFGGQTDPMHNLGGVSMNKLWNAYMLFYQRVSSIEKSKEIFKPSKPNIPVCATVPIPLANQITKENERLIRSFCLMDPLYASLVVNELQLVQKMPVSYPERQRSEVSAVSLGLDTFEQLVARNKDHMGHDAIIEELQSLLKKGTHTASRTLWWFCEHPSSIGNLVLKTTNADAVIRREGLMLIISALKHYQKFLSYIDLPDSERETSQIHFERIVENIVDLFDELWPNILTLARTWDDYFEFFSHLADAGIGHIGVMLDHGILLKCLEVLWLDHSDKTRLRGHYLQHCKLVEKGRLFSYVNLMTLCSTLLATIDLSLPPVATTEQRKLSPDGKYPPSTKEARILTATNDEGCLLLIMKIFQTEHFAELLNSRLIIASYLASEPDAGILNDVAKTLEHGLRLSPVEVCIPYLGAALVFCKKSPTKESVFNLITYVAKGVESIDNVAGLEHLEFFIFLCQAENERAGLSLMWFNQVVQDRIPDFAPTLLIDTDRRVRSKTSELLSKLLFIENSELHDEARAHHSLIAHQLVPACLLRISRSFTDGSQHAPVESPQVSTIKDVVRYCMGYYYDNSEEDLKIMEEANQTLLILDQLTVEVPDDLVSESDMPSPEEWENTSPLVSDDEIGLTVSP